MKQKALAIAIKRIVWANVALSAAMAGTAFAQTAPAASADASAAVSAQAAAPATAAAPEAASAATAAPAAAAPAAPAAANEVKKIKRFEVTGSLIRQADKTGFQSVQVVSQKQIQDSGAVSVSDFLRSTTANSANSWSEGQSNNFAGGAAGMALRGLSEKYTLVLVDGQRVAPYAFFSNSVDNFFDLNALPLNVIDRIEIVKTGAVSQYGSDAIAGVVNVITKHDYQGLELGGSYGATASNGGGNGTTKFSILGGIGNLTSDGWNVTGSASVYQAAGSTLADAGGSMGSADFTNQPGGLSMLSPSYETLASGATQALSPCPNGGSVVSAATNYLGAAQHATPGSTVCGINTAGDTSLLPETQRVNAKVHADFKINDNTTAFVDVLGSHEQTTQNNGVTIIGNPQGSPLVYTPGALNEVSILPSITDSNGLPITYSFPVATGVKTDASYVRASAGVKGSLNLPVGNDWDWAASVSHSQSDVSNTYYNVMSVAGYEKLANGAYNYSNPSSLPGGLFTNASNIGISKLDTVDLTMSTPSLFHLPTGDVGFGLGAQFLHESEDLTPGGEYASGLIVNPDLETVIGQRNVAAVYYQFDVPLLEGLSFSQSGRYDHYSDFGGAFSPRFALRYQPVKAFTAYMSYNRGFRAPTFVEDSNSQTIGIQQQANGTVTTITAGNPNVQAERTKNYNIGFEVSPTKTTDVGFDWYYIHINNVIGEAPTPSQTVVDQSTGQIAYEVYPYENLGPLDTSGFETTFRQALPTSIGTFTLSADWAYINTFKLNTILGWQNAAGNDLTLAEPFGGSFPRWKGNTTLNWNYHKWNAALTWQYVGPYTNTLGSLGGDPAPTAPAAKVGSYSTFNLMATYTGFKHWTIYGGIDNIFNRVPPYDYNYATNALDQNGYDQSLYTYYGRYLQIGANYKF